MPKTPPLNIKDPEVYQLARQLSKQTGETLKDVVKSALQNTLRSQPRRTVDRELMITRLRQISSRVAKLPVLDARSPDEIIGYDERGLPE